MLLDTYRRLVRSDHRLLAWVVGRGRRLLVRWYDPDVTVDMFDRPLTIPFSHDLPFTKADHPGYGDNLRRVIDVIADATTSATVVDVGANVGDSVIMAYRPDVSFLCVEGHPGYFGYLEHNTAALKNVVCVPAMVGAPGHRLVLDAVNGTASPQHDSRGTTTRALADIVADEGGGATVDLLKIDTDGYDADVLMSSMDWLVHHRPVVFFEYDPGMQPRGARPIRSVLHDLVEAGYSWIMVWDKFGDLLVAVEGDQVMDDLDRYVMSGPARYFDVCMTVDETIFTSIRAAEHGRRQPVPA